VIKALGDKDFMGRTIAGKTLAVTDSRVSGEAMAKHGLG
jgi:hypothetical protein